MDDLVDDFSWWDSDGVFDEDEEVLGLLLVEELDLDAEEEEVLLALVASAVFELEDDFRSTFLGSDDEDEVFSPPDFDDDDDDLLVLDDEVFPSFEVVLLSPFVAGA